MVTQKVNNYREGLVLRKYNNQSVMTFTGNNSAHDPEKPDRIMGTYFTNLTQVQKIIEFYVGEIAVGGNVKIFAFFKMFY